MACCLAGCKGADPPRFYSNTESDPEAELAPDAADGHAEIPDAEAVEDHAEAPDAEAEPDGLEALPEPDRDSDAETETAQPDPSRYQCSEDGWCWMHPWPPAGEKQITSLFALNECSLWVTGVDGLILYWDGQRWRNQNSGVDHQVEDLWASAPDSAWAVSHSGSQPEYAILHYDGESWSDVGIDYPGSTLAVWGSDPEHVWVVGSSVLFWNGVEWTEQSTPVPGELWAVWGLGPDRVWAAGTDGLILFFDGERWSVQASGTEHSYLAGWAHDANHVWAVGYGYEATRKPRILFFDGESWQPQPVVASGWALYDVWGSAKDDVWAVGRDGTRLHFDGAAWTAEQLGSLNYYGVHGLDRSHVWMAGRIPEILFFDGERWSSMISDPTPRENLESIWGLGSDAVWAVGESGTIVRWDGSGWQAEHSTPGTWLRDVGGVDEEHLWAVGYHGQILKRDPNLGWIVQDSGTTAALHGIWASGSDNAWVAGDGGLVLHWDGDRWDSVPGCCSGTGAPSTAYSIWGAAPGRVWVGGGVESTNAAYIGLLDDDRWSVEYELTYEDPPPGTRPLSVERIHGTGEDNVWAVGRALELMGGYYSSTALHRQPDGSWLQLHPDPEFLGQSLWAQSPERVYLAGGKVQNAFQYWDGQDFRTESAFIGANGEVNAIWGGDPERLWAVGTRGMILFKGEAP